MATYPEYPPDQSDEEQKYLLTSLKDWSIAHGLAVRPTTTYVSAEIDPSGALATTAPVTLFPSLFPRVCFEQAKSVAQDYNELYSAIASDEEWLKQTVEELVDIDDFIAQLWKVHLAVKQQGYVQPLNLGLFRSDYMVHTDPANAQSRPCVKQVEFNTIASSFGGLSTQVSALHKYLFTVGAYPEAPLSVISDAALPESTSVPGLAMGMAKAHEAYGPSKDGLATCVLFLVQDPERNVFDQRHVEYVLNKNYGVKTFRLPFGKVLNDTKLDADRKLVYSPPHAPSKQFEVTLVYFRAGYSPAEYQNQRDWDGRLQIERSAAIKCPSILTQLAGTKKVQQVLATPHSPHLKRFLPDEARAAELLKTFAPIYPMDKSEAGEEARKLAQDPETAVRYVLKPQREGGGNNVYRKAIPRFLKDTPETHWPAHILMEMIEPPAQSNVIFRNGELQKGGVICELGIYGACLWRDEDGKGKREILENFEAGYLLRTKGCGSEEGGVAAGFGSVDSACLIDVD
ncbi:Glutathione synthetase [Friedmanniomyces endolithicus]|uniref:Glutathione synthetase n=2 Tax=Friedmanniomyces endolithicus TaxID=329885 RepID=A0AAN6QUP9_9PEZI|nr:Glutathione synthetase [Friedmanniomyces endolithicus]KAK0280788.1 Glutathione synthetase [Friedmanniomyces endolithicus]KAK0282571.1 Glutathione synthetase [Friedmanniomyces endolithicus]KAK0304530.1 Glutathione synthetase [Friedmanniomyces endolithicus]KAK0826674.1 Glutathione synthetase [Friedmanniomyces endolithicus]